MTLYEESRKIWLKMDSEELAELKMKAIETYGNSNSSRVKMSV